MHDFENLSTFTHTHTNPDGSTVEIRVTNTRKHSSPLKINIHPTVFIGQLVELVGGYKIEIDPFARIEDGVKLVGVHGNGFSIGAAVVIGHAAVVTTISVGAHSVIGANANLEVVKIGTHVKIGSDVKVTSGHGSYGAVRAEIHDTCEIGAGVVLHIGQSADDGACVLAEGSRIGERSNVCVHNRSSSFGPKVPALLVGSGVTIQRSVLEVPRDRQCSTPVTIGDGAWVGEGSTLLPGATVPNGAVLERNTKVGPDSHILVAGQATVTLAPAGVNVLGPLSADAVELLRQLHVVTTDLVTSVRAEADQRMKSAEGRVRVAEEKVAELAAQVVALSYPDDAPDYNEDDQPSQQ